MRKPIRTGYLQDDNFVDDPRGNLRLYVENITEHCVIGADVAEGVEEDENAAVVLSCVSNSTLAAFNSGKIDPDQFAIFLAMLGKFCRTPLIGVERNAVGFSVISDLLKLYPSKRIYFHYRLDEKTKVKTKKFGWWTNEHTRHLMLGHLKQEIREGSTELLDKQLIQQCMKFVVNENGKPEAAEGEKDDLVIGRAIAGMMKRHQPSLVEPQEVPHAPRIY
jgi:hypothetical protein